MKHQKCLHPWVHKDSKKENVNWSLLEDAREPTHSFENRDFPVFFKYMENQYPSRLSMQVVSLDFQTVERNKYYIEIPQLINEGRMLQLEYHHSVIPKRWIDSVIDHQWPLTSQNERQPVPGHCMLPDWRGLVGGK